jgi:hypothetical protein
MAIGGYTSTRVESGLSRNHCDCRYCVNRSHSPDGRWILYFSVPKGSDDYSSTTLRLMRIPVTGGPSEQVLTARFYNTPWCARSPSTLCAFAEQSPDRKQLVFTAFDPIREKGQELAKFATDPNADYSNWSPFSPLSVHINDSLLLRGRNST